MKQIPIKLGPLTLLLTVISICLTVLAILSFTTARADLRLAEKYADTVRSRYALEKQGQAFRQELSETDPADYGLSGWERDKDGVYHTVLTRDDLSLSIGFCLGARFAFCRCLTVIAFFSACGQRAGYQTQHQ